MGIKSDTWIRRMVIESRMIEPFADAQLAKAEPGGGRISFGLSSYGYDIRVADEYKVFNNKAAGMIDPKKMDPNAFYDFKGEVCVIPPNSFVLARSIEYFRIPRQVMTICFGKCVTGDTRIVDASSGCLRTIKETILRKKGTAASLNKHLIRSAAVTEGVKQGARPVYKVVTRTGRAIRATSNHPFLTFTGWVPLQNLRLGSRIGVPRRIPIFGERSWPEYEVDMLGLLISDGQCATPGSSPRYTSGDPVLREYFSRAVGQFGCVPKPVAGCSVNATNTGRRGGIMERNKVYKWLESLGLAVKSPEKFIPPAVFELRPRLLARFLQALFSGDGGISVGGDGIHLEFCSTSELLARDVHHLLLRFGVVSRIRYRSTDSGRGAFVLSINSKDHIVRFAKAIGFVEGSQKQRRLEDVLEKICHEPQMKSNYDTLPPEAWSLMQEACHSKGVSLRKAGIIGTHPDQSVPRKMTLELAKRLGDENLGDVADSDILWDKIQEIRYEGIETVYDLTLPETANFVANDIVVHNSTYARCGIITNVTPFEPEWEGYVTMGISNTTPLPAKIYAGEGIAQVLFFEADEVCAVSYQDKKGKYQAQKTITVAKAS